MKLSPLVLLATLTAASRSSKLAPIVPDARSKRAPIVPDARSKRAPIVPDARSKRAPIVPDAQSKRAPIVSDAQSKRAPIVPDAQGKRAPIVPKLDVEAPTYHFGIVPKHANSRLAYLIKELNERRSDDGRSPSLYQERAVRPAASNAMHQLLINFFRQTHTDAQRGRPDRAKENADNHESLHEQSIIDHFDNPEDFTAAFNLFWESLEQPMSSEDDECVEGCVERCVEGCVDDFESAVSSFSDRLEMIDEEDLALMESEGADPEAGWDILERPDWLFEDADYEFVDETPHDDETETADQYRDQTIEEL